MDTERFDRNTRFFGVNGQAKLTATNLVVVGVGGLGTHVVQQAALLGLGTLTLIDHERLSTSNLNRYVGVRPSDVGLPKVELAVRLALEINPNIRVSPIARPLASREAFDAIRACDAVMGCVDREGARLVLTEVASAADKPYFDLATDIDPRTNSFGGRVVVKMAGMGCLVCREVIDLDEAARDLAGEAGRRAHEGVYGVPAENLDAAGPSVVSINGVVASLGVTELLAMITGIRPPKPMLTYRGDLGTVLLSVDEPAPSCHYCHVLRGRWEAAGVEKYLVAADQ